MGTPHCFHACGCSLPASPVLQQHSACLSLYLGEWVDGSEVSAQQRLLVLGPLLAAGLLVAVLVLLHLTGSALSRCLDGARSRSVLRRLPAGVLMAHLLLKGLELAHSRALWCLPTHVAVLAQGNGSLLLLLLLLLLHASGLLLA